MKRNVLALIIVAALLGGAISIYYTKTRFKKGGLAEEVKKGSFISAQEQRALIAENIKKYQPKETENTRTKNPPVSAKAAIVVDENTNEILYSKNIHTKLPPASIQKTMTLSVALEQKKANDLIEVSQTASGQISNKINLSPGEKIRLSDLLYGLMMISANDAAWAIAEGVDGGFPKFISLMNEKAALLGLKNTSFKNPAGLDDGEQYSTAFDLATITRYALLEHPEVIKYAGKRGEHSVQMTDHNEPHWWAGHLSHMLSSYPYMIAAKTGYTDEAGTTYIGIAKKGNRKLVVVILGANGGDANNDVKSLLDFGFSS